MTEDNNFDGPNAPIQDDYEFKETSSFREIWDNSPMLKAATLGAGVLVLVAGYFLFSGGDENDIQSRVKTASSVKGVAGGAVDEQYEEALKEVDKQRYDQAVAQQGSTLPIPRGGLQQQRTSGEGEEDQVYEDPLARWRKQAEEREQKRQKIQERSQVFETQRQRVVTQQAEEKANTDALASAMVEQIKTIFESRQIQGAKVVNVTSPDYVSPVSEETTAVVGRGNQPLGAGSGDQSVDPDQEVEEQTIIVPAGEIYYGQLVTEANSDVNSPILGRIYTGPLKGGKVIGSFSTTQSEKLVLRFNKVVLDGVDYPINALAVDPATTSSGMATDINRHWLTRVVLPGAASFIEGFANAFAQRENNITVVTGGDTVVEEADDLNTEGQIATGVAAAAQEVGEALDDIADAHTEPTIIVGAGTPIGLLFVDAVTD